jgi:DNA-binding SARP family transcriptional activator
MSRLNILLLGPPRFERDGQPLDIDTRKSIALLAYLALTGEAHRREALVTLLWPEAEPRQGRAILRRNLSVLNKTLGGGRAGRGSRHHQPGPRGRHPDRY